MNVLPAYPRIPYGEADFRRIRRNRWLYVDKTRFLRRLEEERYAFLIRPRRFGKSLWISLLENYYDRFWADDFDATFAGTDIGDLLHDRVPGQAAAPSRPVPRSGGADILAPPSIATKLTELFRYAGDHDIPLYVLIDEYDNFANTVLAYHGAEAFLPRSKSWCWCTACAKPFHCLGSRGSRQSALTRTASLISTSSGPRLPKR